MTKTFLDLQRRFVRLTSTDWSVSAEDMAAARRDLRTWGDVLSNDVSVVVAPANAGKTSEFRRQSQSMRDAGLAAVFIAVRELMSVDEVRVAIEPDERNALEAWQSNPSGPIAIFIDSIDEAAMESPRQLRIALRKVTNEVIGVGPLRWILSTRPAALNAEVLRAIGQALELELEFPTDEDSPLARLGDANATVKVKTSPAESQATAVALYKMAKLSAKQAFAYLEKKLKVEQPQTVIDAAAQHGMGFLLETPGRLNILRELDLVAKPPSSLAEVFLESIRLHLDAPSGERKNAVRVTRDQLDGEARRLAAASSLCNKLNIKIPGREEPSKVDALSARLIVNTLSDTSLHFLLSTGLFEDSGHHQAKLQPDDFRNVLAATRLDELIGSRQDAAKVASVLCWKAPTGESGVFPEWVPLAGWLATFNRYFRAECLAVDPQCVAFFGDLRSMPVAEAERVLEAAMERVANGERMARGMYSLTPENYWQAGPPALAPCIQRLLDKHTANEEVQERLIQIARYARLHGLREQLLAQASGDFGRLLKNVGLLTYFLDAGSEQDRLSIKRAALAADKLDEIVVRLVIEKLSSKYLTGNEVVRLVTQCDEASHSLYMLKYPLVEDAGPSFSTGELLVLSQGLLALLTRDFPPESDAEDWEPVKAIDWLAETLLELFVQLASRVLDTAQTESLALLIRDLYVRVLSRDYQTIDIDALQSVLSPPSLLRTLVMQHLLVYVGDDLPLLWRVFLGGRPAPLLHVDVDEARAVGSESQAKALEQRAASVAPVATPRTTRQARRIDEATQHKQELFARIVGIRRGTDVEALSWVAQFLSDSHYSQVSFQRFRNDFGDELADAVHDGLIAMWRLQPPRHDDAQPRTIYLSTIAGIQGASLAFAAADGSTSWLTAPEAQRALDYGLYEINGLPKWYWDVAAEHGEVAKGFLEHTLQGFGTSALATERSVKVLSSLAGAPAGLRNALIPAVWNILTGPVALDWHVLSRALAAVTASDGVARDQFFKHARERAFSPGAADHVIWAANWFLVDPDSFMDELGELRATASSVAERLITDLAVYLEDDRGLQVANLRRRSPRAAAALKQLYLSVREVVRPEDDVVHTPGEVYPVGDRDRAERLRDRLPELIAAGDDAASYAALRELSAVAASPEEGRWMLRLALKVAESMHRVSYMSEADFLGFERSLRRRPDSEEAFAQDVENDILDLKDVIEAGEFSPRRFLASSFQHLEEAQMRAMEDEFQLLLAGHLELLGRKRYSVVREPQLAEDTRRDISILHGPRDWRVTLELKVSRGGWTLEDYRTSLREQLVGRYMTARNSKVGFLVILLQAERSWFGPDRQKMSFAELLKALRAYAFELQSEKPELRLRVIGIDAREPTNADGQPLRKKSRRKNGS